jgi:hypothetical protein
LKLSISCRPARNNRTGTRAIATWRADVIDAIRAP